MFSLNVLMLYIISIVVVFTLPIGHLGGPLWYIIENNEAPLSIVHSNEISLLLPLSLTRLLTIPTVLNYAEFNKCIFNYFKKHTLNFKMPA